MSRKLDLCFKIDNLVSMSGGCISSSSPPDNLDEIRSCS